LIPSDVFLINLPSESATEDLAALMAQSLIAGDLLILSGGLGAGKTFFARAFCYARGLDGAERVTSPTFAIMQEYPTCPPIVHSDLYRLTEEEEVLELGLEEARAEGQILLVEWGKPFVDLLGGEAIYLDLSVEPRSAKVHGNSARAQDVIRALLNSRTGEA